jgi:hypothetical protein
MRVKVEGLITSIEQKTKGDKNFTNLLLAQTGEREQVQVRLLGHVADNYDELERIEFEGRLMTWTQRDGVGSMVMADVPLMG